MQHRALWGLECIDHQVGLGYSVKHASFHAIHLNSNLRKKIGSQPRIFILNYGYIYNTLNYLTTGIIRHRGRFAARHGGPPTSSGVGSLMKQETGLGLQYDPSHPRGAACPPDPSPSHPSHLRCAGSAPAPLSKDQTGLRGVRASTR